MSPASCSRSERGVTMIEVLITIVISSFGLLAIASLQARMHLSEMEAYQRAQATVLRFFEQWLGLDRLPEVNRDPALFPEWNDDLRRALREDASRFFVEMVFRERAGLDALYTARRAWPSDRVAVLYGVESAGGSEVALPEERPTAARVAGLLVGFLGVVVVLGPWHALGGGELTGQLMCLGASVGYGLAFPYLRRTLSGRPESALSVMEKRLSSAAPRAATASPTGCAS